MKIIILLLLSIPLSGFTQTGRLFTVQLSLQGSLTKMIMQTNIPKHLYQTAGITLPSGYSFANGTCPQINGSTCVFQVSNTKPVTLLIDGTHQNFTSTLCLNQPYQLNCETITAQFTTHVLEMGAYAGGANGQIYTGYNNSNWTLYSPNSFTDHQFKGSYCANDGTYCIAGGFTGTSNTNFTPSAYTQVNQNGVWVSGDTSNTTSGLSNPIQFWSVSCVPDSQYCIASGNGAIGGGGQLAYVWYSYDAGFTWSTPNSVPPPTGGGYSSYQAFGTSCYSSTTDGPICVIAGNSANNVYGLVARGPVVPNQPINLTSTYIQSTSSINPNFVDVTDVHCTHQGHCILSANLSNSTDPSNPNPEFSAIYYSNDGGATWSPSQITSLSPPDGLVSNVSGVSCDASGVNCVASGWYSTSLTNAPAQGIVYVSHDGGLTWPRTIVFPYPSPESNVNRFNAIRCNQTNSICYVTGHGGNSNDNTEYPISYISYDNGKTWSNVSFLPLPASQQSSPSSNLFTLALFNTIQ